MHLLRGIAQFVATVVLLETRQICVISPAPMVWHGTQLFLNGWDLFCIFLAQWLRFKGNVYKYLLLSSILNSWSFCQVNSFRKFGLCTVFHWLKQLTSSFISFPNTFEHLCFCQTCLVLYKKKTVFWVLSRFLLIAFRTVVWNFVLCDGSCLAAWLGPVTFGQSFNDDRTSVSS